MSERRRVDCQRCGWTVPVGSTGPITALREHWANDHNGVPKVRAWEPDNPKGAWREMK